MPGDEMETGNNFEEEFLALAVELSTIDIQASSDNRPSTLRLDFQGCLAIAVGVRGFPGNQLPDDRKLLTPGVFPRLFPCHCAELRRLNVGPLATVIPRPWHSQNNDECAVQGGRLYGLVLALHGGPRFC